VAALRLPGRCWRSVLRGLLSCRGSRKLPLYRPPAPHCAPRARGETHGSLPKREARPVCRLDPSRHRLPSRADEWELAGGAHKAVARTSRASWRPPGRFPPVYRPSPCRGGPRRRLGRSRPAHEARRLCWCGDPGGRRAPERAIRQRVVTDALPCFDSTNPQNRNRLDPPGCSPISV